MHPYRIWHNIAVILGIITLFIISYATILLNNFKTPEATADFFKNSNSYFYIAEIAKAQIRNNYPAQLRDNILELTAADTLLNNVVTTNTVERIALPVLKTRSRIAKLPLSFAENNLVLHTQKYTQQFSSTLASLQLPPILTDVGNKLIAAVPEQITIVDTKEHPNSILATITKVRIFFTNLQKILNASWIIFILCIVTIFVINLLFLKRLISGFMWVFGITGIILLIASFIIPPIIDGISSNPDPVSGILKDQLINSMVSYYFSLTRTLSLIFLGIGIILFFIKRFVPVEIAQTWVNQHILQPTPATTANAQNNRTSRQKKGSRKK